MVSEDVHRGTGGLLGDGEGVDHGVRQQRRILQRGQPARREQRPDLGGLSPTGHEAGQIGRKGARGSPLTRWRGHLTPLDQVGSVQASAGLGIITSGPFADNAGLSYRVTRRTSGYSRRWRWATSSPSSLLISP